MSYDTEKWRTFDLKYVVVCASFFDIRSKNGEEKVYNYKVLR